MSNKPKIWSHCDAGCLWETVHKDDFQSSAAFIKQEVIDSHGIKEFYMKAGQTCIFTGDIEPENGWGWDVYVIVENRQGDELSRIGFARTFWDTSIRLKYCGVFLQDDGTYTLYYEKNGTNGGQKSIEGLTESEVYLHVMNVDEVYLVNDAMYAVVDAEEVSV